MKNMKSFAEISLTRRALLRGMLLAPLAAMPLDFLATNTARATPQPFISIRALARPRALAEEAAPNPMLDSNDIAILRRIVEIIIPGGDTPGAHETNTLDFVVYNLRRQGDAAIIGVKQALAGVDQISINNFGQPFVLLPANAALQVVGIISAQPLFALFWSSIRRLTVFHYYAQPAGYRTIGLPGPSIDRGGYPNVTLGTEQICVPL